MRNFKPISALVILLALPNLAQAGVLENTAGVADCNSWSADLTISFPSHTVMSRVEYTVIVQDAAGTEVDRFDYADFITIPDTPTAVFNFGGTWHTPLDGSYTVTGDFTVYDIFGEAYNLTYGSFTTDLACGNTDNDDEPVCLHSARYWVRHPDLWPVTSLEISGQMHDQTELMHMLGKHRRHNRNFRRIQRLARQLVAAKLNLANGGSDDIQPVVARAEKFIANPPSGRRAWAHRRAQVMHLKQAMRHYNRRGCEELGATSVAVDASDYYLESADKAAVENMSLGTIKAMYQ